MKHWTRVSIVVGLIILVSSVVLYWQRSRHIVEMVTVIEPSVGILEQTITATGSVEARRKVLVTAEPGTRIAALYFEEQNIVAHGQVLATVKSRINFAKRLLRKALRPMLDDDAWEHRSP
jgi:multidrug efflux pump subunit AcrA (membrane-fusion protein)